MFICASLLPGFLNESWQNSGYLPFQLLCRLYPMLHSALNFRGLLNPLVICCVQAQQINQVSKNTHSVPPLSSLCSFQAKLYPTELQSGKKWDTRPLQEGKNKDTADNDGKILKCQQWDRVRGMGVGSYSRRIWTVQITEDDVWE